MSDRDDLPGDGMLLQWNARGPHPIWMADMRFSLDLVWLEDGGRVAGVLANVPVCSPPTCPVYEPNGTHESVAVLEVAAGPPQTTASRSAPRFAAHGKHIDMTRSAFHQHRHRLPNERPRRIDHQQTD